MSQKLDGLVQQQAVFKYKLDTILHSLESIKTQLSQGLSVTSQVVSTREKDIVKSLVSQYVKHSNTESYRNISKSTFENTLVKQLEKNFTHGCKDLHISRA
jgi:nitrogenase subunit NifH